MSLFKFLQGLNSVVEQPPVIPVPKKALVMGTNYLGTNNKLTCCVKDCIRMSKMLESMGYTVRRFYSQKTPVCQVVFESLDRWFAELKPGDKAVFYYSGHGTHVEGDKSNSEEDNNDEALFIGNNCLVLDDYLRKLVQSVPAGVELTCIFDCCESGTMLDMPLRYEKSEKFVDNDHVFLADVVVLSGCRDGKYSYESDGTGHLTDAVIRTIGALQNKRTRGGKRLKIVMNWYDFYLQVYDNMIKNEEWKQEIQLSYSSDAAIQKFWL